MNFESVIIKLMAESARTVLSSIQNSTLKVQHKHDDERRDVLVQLWSNKNGNAGTPNSGYTEERSDVLLQICAKKYGQKNASGSGKFILFHNNLGFLLHHLSRHYTRL